MGWSRVGVGLGLRLGLRLGLGLGLGLALALGPGFLTSLAKAEGSRLAAGVPSRLKAPSNSSLPG